MPLLDLISLSFSSFIFLSLFPSPPFSLLFFFLSFFLFLFLSTSLRLYLLSSSRFFSLYLCFSHSLPSVSPRDPAISLYTMVRCALAFKHLAAFSRSRPRMKGMSSDALGPLYAFFFSFYSSALLSGHPDFWLKLPFRRHSSCITLPLPLLLDRRVPLRNLCSPRQQHPGSTPCDHTTYDVVRLHTTGCDSFTDIFVACHAPFPYGRSYMGV